MLLQTVHCSVPVMISIIFSLVVPALAGSPIYVKADATGTSNGTSWTNAFTDLQSALARVRSGEEIWVATGTYKPTNGIDRSQSFVLVDGVSLFGGFAGFETSRNQRDMKGRETILSGDIGVNGSVTDNSYHVVIGASHAVLDGFTVTAGRSFGNGAGMYNENVFSLTISNCFFYRNTAYVYNGADGGSGIFNRNCSVSISFCQITENIVTGPIGGQGGGMNNDRSDVSLQNCTFTRNEAQTSKDSGGYGGGMHNYGGAISLSDCVFIGNIANTGSGGGIFNDYSYPEIQHRSIIRCSFMGNSAKSGGGGVCGDFGSQAIIRDCKFSGNTAGQGGGFSGSSANIINCLFIGNSSTELGPWGGGGVCIQGSPNLTNCVFYRNTSKSVGGAIENANYGSPKLLNCTLTSNTALYGGGVYNREGTVMLTNCIIWGNGANNGLEISTGPEIKLSKYLCQYCDIRGSGGSGSGWNANFGTDSGGNIDVNPLFADSEHPTGADGAWLTVDDGFCLRFDSPCIDTGIAIEAPLIDVLNRLRFGMPDIGAYEYPPNHVARWPIYD